MATFQSWLAGLRWLPLMVVGLVIAAVAVYLADPDHVMFSLVLAICAVAFAVLVGKE